MTVAAGVSIVLAAVGGALLVPAPPRPRGPRSTPAASDPGSPSAAGVLPGAGACAAGLGAAVMVGGSLAVPLGLVVGAVVWAALRRMESPSARRRRERLERELPHVVDLLGTSLRAGLAPGAAVGVVVEAVGPGPVAEDLAAVATRTRWGGDPVVAWRDLGSHPQLGRLGRTMARALDSGASVADALAGLAEDLRRDRHSRVEALARSVGVRSAAPLGVCMLPAFVLVGVVPLVVGSLGGLLR